MTELRDMKDAPRDGTEILALYSNDGNSYWIVVCYIINIKKAPWHAGNNIQYEESELAGWLPLPPIPD